MASRSGRVGYVEPRLPPAAAAAREAASRRHHSTPSALPIAAISSARQLREGQRVWVAGCDGRRRAATVDSLTWTYSCSPEDKLLRHTAVRVKYERDSFADVRYTDGYEIPFQDFDTDGTRFRLFPVLDDGQGGRRQEGGQSSSEAGKEPTDEHDDAEVIAGNKKLGNQGRGHSSSETRVGNEKLGNGSTADMNLDAMSTKKNETSMVGSGWTPNAKDRLRWRAERKRKTLDVEAGAEPVLERRRESPSDLESREEGGRVDETAASRAASVHDHEGGERGESSPFTSAESASGSSNAEHMRGGESSAGTGQEEVGPSPPSVATPLEHEFRKEQNVWVSMGKARHPAMFDSYDGPRMAVVKWSFSNTKKKVAVDQLHPMHENDQDGAQVSSSFSRRERKATDRFSPIAQPKKKARVKGERKSDVKRKKQNATRAPKVEQDSNFILKNLDTIGQVPKGVAPGDGWELRDYRSASTGARQLWTSPHGIMFWVARAAFEFEKCRRQCNGDEEAALDSYKKRMRALGKNFQIISSPHSTSVASVAMKKKEERTERSGENSHSRKYSNGTTFLKKFTGYGVWEGVVTGFDGEKYEATYEDGYVERHITCKAMDEVMARSDRLRRSGVQVVDSSTPREPTTSSLSRCKEEEGNA